MNDDEGRLGDAIDRLERDGRLADLHGLVVVRDGEVVLERYGEGDDYRWADSLGFVRFGPDTLHDLRSVSKSVTALLYGIAFGRGLVPAPSEPLLPQFPEYADLASEPARLALTVEHALTMSLGIEWREDLPYSSPANAEIAMELAPDRYRFVLERRIVEPPGTRWQYCGGATALLGALIERGSGDPLPEFAHATLFGPLGIDSFGWNTGDDGVASPASGLRLAPRDLARIGELVLADGRSAGRSLVPSDWLGALLTPRIEIEPGRRYGYQWYLGETAGVAWVAAMGNGGQRLVVARDLRLVIALTAGRYDREDQAALADAVVEALLAAASERGA